MVTDNVKTFISSKRTALKETYPSRVAATSRYIYIYFYCRKWICAKEIAIKKDDSCPHFP